MLARFFSHFLSPFFSLSLVLMKARDWNASFSPVPAKNSSNSFNIFILRTNEIYVYCKSFHVYEYADPARISEPNLMYYKSYAISLTWPQSYFCSKKAKLTVQVQGSHVHEIVRHAKLKLVSMYDSGIKNWNPLWKVAKAIKRKSNYGEANKWKKTKRRKIIFTLINKI